MRHVRSVPILVALVFLAGLVAVSGAKAPASAPAPQHPEVDEGVDCVSCHELMTEQVVEEWYQGAHGKFGVKCFVCHGSVGADFKLVPDEQRCVGCHADNVTSMKTGLLQGKSCFSCHPSHALDPHALSPAKGGPS